MMTEGWRDCTVGDLLTLEYGKALPERTRTGEGFPVYGSNGVVGFHSEYLVEGPGVVVGRKGTAGSVTWSSESFFPIDTTYWVKRRDPESLNLRYSAILLESVDLPGVCAQTGVPGLNRDRAYEIPVMLPPIEEQERIVDLVIAAEAHASALQDELVAIRALRSRLIGGLTRGEEVIAETYPSVVEERLAG